MVARPSTDGDLAEMVAAIEGLLRRREAQANFPLVDLFRVIMAGQTLDQQRKAFGDRPRRAACQVIVQTIEEYAQSSGSAALLHLLARMRDGGGTDQRRVKVQPARPVLSDRERDYASIVSVVARFDRPVGSADLGRVRRRWLEYPPRDAASGYRNRREGVLAARVRYGVLRAMRTAGGATVYGPGPGFEVYNRQPADL